MHAGASRYRVLIFQSGGLAVIVPLSEYDFFKRALVVHANKEAVVSGDVRLTYKKNVSRERFWGNQAKCVG